MNQSSRIRAAWRSSTSMIFWGVLALTIFGWVTAILELIYTVLNSIFNIAAKANDGLIPVYNNDSFTTFLSIYENVTTSMRIFEVLTIAGWMIYVIGLMQFKNAQVTQRGLRLSGSLNTACWLGLSGIFCSFIAGFLGLFGLLFRFIGWVLMLISLFKFRGTFGRLSWEKSWNKKAQNGASKLKTSYTLAIILEFFPLICGVVVFLAAFGAIGNSLSIARDFMDYGMGAVGPYLAGGIGFIVILCLLGLSLWICKIIWLFSGWSKIKNGCIRKEILAGQTQHVEALSIEEEEDEDCDEEELIVMTESDPETSEEEKSEEEEEESSDNKRNWIICGSIAGGAILLSLILWLCLGGKGVESAETDMAEPTEETEYTEEAEQASVTDMTNGTDMVTEDESELSNEEEADAVYDTYTQHLQGTINDKYAIEMTLTTDGGAYYTGEYFYTKNKTPIQLRGQLVDDYEILELEEYAGLNMTGKFRGKLLHGVYSGTWTSADGEKSFPFLVKRK